MCSIFENLNSILELCCDLFNRFGFRGTPAVLLTAHPKLGDRHVRLTYLTDWIERKLKDEFKVRRFKEHFCFIYPI